jgi:hypothetical protein
MFLWQLHLDLLKNISSVSLKGSIEGTISINDNESKFIIIFQENLQSFSVELVITEVEELVDWLERFEVKVNLLLSFTIFH